MIAIQPDSSHNFKDLLLPAVVMLRALPEEPPKDGGGYKGETFDGTFGLLIDNFFALPKKTSVDSDVFEFCGFSFVVIVRTKMRRSS